MKLKLVREHQDGTVANWELIAQNSFKKTVRIYGKEDESGNSEMLKVKDYQLIIDAMQVINEKSTWLYYVRATNNKFKTMLNLKSFWKDEVSKSSRLVIAKTVHKPQANQHIKVYAVEDTTKSVYEHDYPKSIKSWKSISNETYTAISHFWKENKEKLLAIQHELELHEKREQLKNALNDIKSNSDLIETRHSEIISRRLTLEKDMKKHNQTVKKFEAVRKYLGDLDYYNIETKFARNNPESMLEEVERFLRWNIRDVKRDIKTVEELDLLNAAESIMNVLNENFFVIVEYEQKVKQDE